MRVPQSVSWTFGASGPFYDKPSDSLHLNWASICIDMVTSIHENWFSARCLNTSKPAGEGAIVMQTAAFLLLALYDGSIGVASCAVMAVDQFAWQLGRRNL